MVEVYYCDLCKIYLPRLDDRERALTIHCRSRTHLQRYVRLSSSKKNDATLRRKAVRVHKERQKLKEKEKKDKKGDDEAAEKGEGEENEATPKETADGETEGGAVEDDNKENPGSPGKKNGDEDDEKMWSEVDKDLSDLLHEGEEPHEDEEETRKERYDRFKGSDKGTTEAEIKANGTLPANEKKKIAADGEEN